MVQWLRLCAPNAGDLGLILGWETRSYMLPLKIPNGRTKTWCRGRKGGRDREKEEGEKGGREERRSQDLHLAQVHVQSPSRAP